MNAVADPPTLERDPGWSDEEWEYQQGLAVERAEAAEQAQAELDAEDDPSKAEGLRGEAGEPTGEMPPADPDPDDALPPAELIVAGLRKGYAKLGGKAPTGGSLTIVGGKVSLTQGTSFEKGQTVRIEAVAVIRKIAQVDTADPQTGQVTSSEQQHSAVVTDIIVTGA